jgi:protein-tyrosine phosphatase
MSFYPARQILPGLWIGSKANAASPDFLQTNKIKVIINVTDSVPWFPASTGLARYRIPIEDAPEENDRLLEVLPSVVEIIRHNVSAQRPVLVHCFAGVSRSSSVVAAYLIATYNMSVPEAIQFVRRRKPETFKPFVVFCPALKTFASRKSQK